MIETSRQGLKIGMTGDVNAKDFARDATSSAIRSSSGSTRHVPVPVVNPNSMAKPRIALVSCVRLWMSRLRIPISIKAAC
jgi:hypothetical protein